MVVAAGVSVDVSELQIATVEFVHPNMFSCCNTLSAIDSSLLQRPWPVPDCSTLFIAYLELIQVSRFILVAVFAGVLRCGVRSCKLYRRLVVFTERVLLLTL